MQVQVRSEDRADRTSHLPCTQISPSDVTLLPKFRSPATCSSSTCMTAISLELEGVLRSSS